MNFDDLVKLFLILEEKNLTEDFINYLKEKKALV
mgnify:CR=1 FL=1